MGRSILQQLSDKTGKILGFKYSGLLTSFEKLTVISIRYLPKYTN